MTEHKPNIIYQYSDKASFVKKDIDLLSERYEVLSQEKEWKNKSMTPFLMLSQLFYYLKNIGRVKAVFVMFGGYWALVPSLISKIFNKPCFIILGGTDCVSFPSLRYGNLRIPSLKAVLRIAYQNATCLLPVHGSLIQSENNYYNKEESKQGLKNHFPGLNFRYKEVFNGFDDHTFSLNGAQRNRNRFVSIASIHDEIRFILKGGDLIFQLAKKYPKYDFYLIGFSENYKKSITHIPDNLFLIPFCGIEELVKLLNSATFYLQLSISEGFPNALCEAMLCGCIPVGSNVGAIPDIIHDENRIIFKRDINEVSSVIDNLLLKNEVQLNELSKSAREYVIHNFSIKKRQQDLFNLIEEYGKK